MMRDGHQDKVQYLFIDHIKPYSIFYLLKFRKSLDVLYYFDTFPPFCQRLYKLLRRLGFLKAKVAKIDRHVGQVRTSTGSNHSQSIRDDARKICVRLREETLLTDPLIDALSSRWNKDKILLYFEQLRETPVRRECARLCLYEWLIKQHYVLPAHSCALFIERPLWFKYLKELADERNLSLQGYSHSKLNGLFNDAKWLLKPLGKIFAVALKKVPTLWHKRSSKQNEKSSNQTESTEPLRPKIAIRYCQQMLSFNKLMRSAFFWLNGTQIPYSDILIYDYISNQTIDEETQKQLRDNKIIIYGSGPGARQWQPTLYMWVLLIRLLTHYVCTAVKCLVRGKKVSLYNFTNLFLLICHYSYWRDFFSKNKISINVTLNFHGRIAQVLALDDMGSVSATFQYSMSDIHAPSSLITSGEDVHFYFSSLFEESMLRKYDLPAGNVIYAGYPYDYIFKQLSSAKEVQDLRAQLQAHGAKFIISFFDENSIDRWDIPASHEEAAKDYEYLLEWLLADETLGIVFKPKSPKNLFERISPLSALIEKAKQTGRCIFLLDSGSVVSCVFPSYAASLSDACIGKLLGATATLEARLAGIPSVLLDLEGIHTHPFYAWNTQHVVYRSWDSLRLAIELYREDSRAFPLFGDWSHMLHALDPFQDGNGSLRMGSFIECVHTAFNEKKSKQTPIAIAKLKFAEQWGSQFVK